MSGAEWMGKWNPRYKSYAAFHGHDPDTQLHFDSIKYPGGVMTGYILWIKNQLLAYRHSVGKSLNEPMFESDQKAFDQWLERKLERK